MHGSSVEDRVSHEGSRNMVRDAAGDHFIAGHTYGSLDATVSNAGGSDIFLMKTDPDGEKLWVKMLGGAGDDYADDVTIDDSGNIFVAMRMTRSTGFAYDATFGQVIKFDGSGTQFWYKEVGSQAVHGRLSISATSDAVYVAGTTDMGNSEVTKLDTDQGTPIWPSPLDLGLKVYEGPRGIAVSGSGEGYVTGFALSSLDGSLDDYRQEEDVFVIKFDYSGQKLWSKMFGSSAKDMVKSIAVDPFGSVYLAGYFGYEDSPSTKIDFMGVTSNGDFDAFLVKYSSSGDLLWSKVWGTSSDNRAQSVDTDENGNVYVAGVSEDRLPQASKFIGLYDLFVTMFDPSGNRLWTNMVGSTEIEDNAGVSASLSSITVVGSTAGVLDGFSSGGADWEIFLVGFVPSCQGVSDGMDLVCPAGHYCPEGIANIAEGRCPRGTFSNHTGFSSIAQCHACSAGMYCGDVGLTKPSGPCNGGAYCTAGAANQIASTCDIRTIECDTSDCENLTPRTPGECGGSCPAGSYCPEGSTTPTLCPAGHYCDQGGLTDISGPCEAGYYCEGYGNTNSRAVECPVGDYCTEGSASPTQCPKGSSSDTAGVKSLADCTKCPAGFFCPAAGGGACSGDDVNQCLGSQEPCPEGYYCPAGSWRGTDSANMCPRGHYCLEESPVPSPCPPKEYQDEYGKASCKGCFEGSFCPGVATFDVLLSPPGFTDRPDGGAVLCTAGGYCHPGLSTPHQCALGYYNPRNGSINITDCLVCPRGFHCNMTGLGQPSGPCDPGYYCLAGAKRGNPPETICPRGYSCPVGSPWPTICRPGTYSSSLGAAICTLVLPGFYSKQQD